MAHRHHLYTLWDKHDVVDYKAFFTTDPKLKAAFDKYAWADGYGKRFGVAYLDYQTQRRLLRLSAQCHGSVIASRGFGLGCLQTHLTQQLGAKNVSSSALLPARGDA